jgi:hypothetical protein
MKLDKETLVKHRFWIFLGVEIPLVLIATLVLLFGVRAAIAAREKVVNGKIKAVAGVTEIRNNDWHTELKKIEDSIEGKLKKLWASGWELQKDLVTWPKSLQHRFRSGLFAVKIKATKEKTELTPVQESERAYLFRGKIKTVPAGETLNPLVVQGPVVTGKDKDGKDLIRQVDREFFLTPKLKLQIGTDPEAVVPSFDRLQDLARQNRDASVEVTFVEAKYFGDDFTSPEKTAYTRDYKQQLPDLFALLLDARDFNAFQRKVKANLKPVIQVEGGWEAKDGQPGRPPAALFGDGTGRRWVDVWEQDKQPDAEKIWNAQEDLWIQRELLRVARDANAYVSKLSGTGGEQEGKKFKFTSPIWMLEIQRNKDKIDATLTNNSGQTQALDLAFMVQVSPPREGEVPTLAELGFAASEDLLVLAPKQQAVVTGLDLSRYRPQGVYAVEQVLTLSTAPVKRIQEMKLGEHSHRTFVKGLQFRKGSQAEKQEAEKAKEAPAEGGPGGGAGGGVRGAGPTGGGSGKGMIPEGARGEGDKKDENPYKRYSDSTPEFRKMPVAMVFIVDQDSVHYVLSAFEKSRLRFQITQVLMTRYTKSLKETKKAGKEDQGEPRERPMVDPKKGPMGPGPVGPRGGGSGRGTPPGVRPPGYGSGGRMGFGSPAGPRGGGSGRMGFGSPVGPRGGGSGGPRFGREEQGGQIIIEQARPETQGEIGTGSGGEQGPVVELVVYGYATIYERYPAKPAAANLDEPSAKP